MGIAGAGAGTGCGTCATAELTAHMKVATVANRNFTEIFPLRHLTVVTVKL
jgi:hypothetical protein